VKILVGSNDRNPAVENSEVHSVLSFFQKVVRRLQRKLFPVAAGHVDFRDAPATDFYRSLGATIGEKVRLMGRIDGVNPQLVSIGDYTVVGAGSILLAHCPVKGGLPCKVGSFVYISYGAIILPGVTIGDHALIGAGAVVTKDVPAFAVVVGNPGRILRYLSEAERQEMHQNLLQERLFGWAGQK
jgi:acetyltransferase-like isoleucine patch superfamily enzyme